VTIAYLSFFAVANPQSPDCYESLLIPMLQVIILLIVNKAGAREGHFGDTASAAAGLCQVMQHLTKWGVYLRFCISYLTVMPWRWRLFLEDFLCLDQALAVKKTALAKSSAMHRVKSSLLLSKAESRVQTFICSWKPHKGTYLEHHV